MGTINAGTVLQGHSCYSCPPSRRTPGTVTLDTKRGRRWFCADCAEQRRTHLFRSKTAIMSYCGVVKRPEPGGNERVESNDDDTPQDQIDRFLTTVPNPCFDCVEAYLLWADR